MSKKYLVRLSRWNLTFKKIMLKIQEMIPNQNHQCTKRMNPHIHFDMCNYSHYNLTHFDSSNIFSTVDNMI